MDKLITSLRAAVGAEQVIADAEELLVYECDGLTHYRARPRAVVFPRSTEEVSEVLRLLAREGVSFAPRGAGTGLSAGALALGGGVQISLARMRKVLKIDAENRLAVVEVGVVNAHVSRAAAPHGLHYAPDPSSQASCTVGGNVAENAGGIHCLKYGTTTDHVLCLRVVLAGGRVVELGGAGGEAPGFDLVGVFVGSEGTFGVATEATVRLTPVAPSVRTLLADFTNIDDASRAVSAVIAEGIIPAALEMVDGATIRAVEASVFAAGLPLDAEAALLVELDGLEAGMDEEVRRVEAICRRSGARGVRLAADEAERKRLWAARKGAFGAMGRIKPDLMLQDAVVPRSRLPEVLAEINRIGAKHRLNLANVFHAGDGNLHPVISYDARDPEEVRRVKEAGREIVGTCVRAGGTITGEHGVGLDKREYLPLVFSEEDLRAMLRVRAAFDPEGWSNPGKIIPELKGCGEARAVVEGKARAAEGAGRNGDAGKDLVDAGDGVVLAAETDARGVRVDENGARSAPPSPSLPLKAFPSTAAVAPRAAKARSAADVSEVRAAFAAAVGDEHMLFDEGSGGAIVVSPATAEEACAVLRAASEVGWGVAPAGASTRPGAGQVLDGPYVVVRTARMSRVVEHEPADLVATVEAGALLCDLNRELGRAGQWLALDPPGAAGATVGGVAAAGIAGPLGLGYGAPRAHVLGMRVALADGSVIRAGGRVVKNVAGYDLCKLFVGSQGALGLILELTFKLRPRPAGEATLLALSPDWRALAARAREAAQHRPVAAELLSPALASALGLSRAPGLAALLLRFDGPAAAVEYQIGRARELLGESAAPSSSEVLETNAQRVWDQLSAYVFDGERPLAWRAGVLPSRLVALIEELEAARGRAGELAWHAGACDGRLRVFESADGDAARVASSLETLRRAARGAGGSLIIERAPEDLKSKVDAWGLSESSAFLMKRVKEQLDPRGLFSPGRFGLTRDE